jgi:hypothetical protein
VYVVVYLLQGKKERNMCPYFETIYFSPVIN